MKASAASFAGTEVAYYQKSSDGRQVIDALEHAGVPYTRTKAQISNIYPVNVVACGQDANVTALKQLLHALDEGHVPIRAVFGFNHPEAKRGRLEILSSTPANPQLASGL